MIQALESNSNVKRGSRLLRNLSMFSVAFLVCILATASSSWLSSEKVFAIGGVPVFTNSVTKQDIEDAKKKRDNAQAVDILRIAMDDAELQAEIKLKHAEEMQAIADEKQRQLDELTSLIGTTQATLDNVNTSIDSWTAREDELAAYAEDLNDEIKRLQEQYDREHGSSSKNTGGASFRWPTYCRWISSPYGWRMHPTQGVEKFHYGIDIGAGYGETIMAAASGTVIFVTEPYEGCNKGGSGYGNYCVIDHGNGYTTLYGHARDLYVYEGQYVNAGDSIGEVGSTGDSSGAHLHFEVRLWGETKDPEDYLP